MNTSAVINTSARLHCGAFPVGLRVTIDSQDKNEQPSERGAPTRSTPFRSARGPAGGVFRKAQAPSVQGKHRVSSHVQLHSKSQKSWGGFSFWFKNHSLK